MLEERRWLAESVLLISRVFSLSPSFCLYRNLWANGTLCDTFTARRLQHESRVYRIAARCDADILLIIIRLADIGAGNTVDRVTRPSWPQRVYMRGFTIHWNATLLDTSGGQVGDPCWQPMLRNFLLNPDDTTEEVMALVCSSIIANHCERQIVSMS